MESSTKQLAESFLLDSLIYGSMLTEEQRQYAAKGKAQLLVDTKKAEDELDAMIAEGEKQSMDPKKPMEYPKPEPITPMMLGGEIPPYNVSKSSTATPKKTMSLSQNQKPERLSEVRDLTPQEN